MRTLVLSAVILAASSLSLAAGAHKVPADQPVAIVTIPDDWTTNQFGGGIEATSSDGEVYLAILKTEGDSIKKSSGEALKYLNGKGVAVTDSSMQQEEGKRGEFDVVEISWDGKIKDRAAKVSLTIVAVTQTEGVLLIYWASPDGVKKNKEALSAIANSITKA